MSVAVFSYGSIGSGDSLGELLSVPFKKGHRLEFEAPLLSYVNKVYPDADESTLTSDIAELQRMRDRLVENHAIASQAQCKAYLVYLLVLDRLEPRFAIGTSHNTHARINFTWFDAFRTGKKTSIPNIHVERAAVLFNLGAVYSNLAANCDRQLTDGLKNAAHNLQRAAGCFRQLRSSESLKASVSSSQLVDVGSSCTSMLEELMLAQAQECVFEDLARARKSPSILARLSEQVAVFYETAESYASRAPLLGHIDAKWADHITIKKLYFRSLAYYYMALQLNADQSSPEKGADSSIKIGEEISRLQFSVAFIGQALELKSAQPKYSSSLTKLHDLEKEALRKAVVANDQIYNQRVPPKDSLPKIQPHALVKAAAIDDKAQEDEIARNLFKAIVPESATREFSKFTNKIDEFTRTEVSRMKESTEDVTKRMADLNIAYLLQAISGSVPLAQPLRTEFETIQSNGGVATLDQQQDQLKHLNQVCKDMLKAIETDLHAESKEDLEMREQYGTQWKRPTSEDLTENIKGSIEHHYGNLKTAAENDEKLARLLNGKRKELNEFLSLSSDKVVPSLQTQMVQVDEPEKLVNEINVALKELNALEETQAEIIGMFQQLKDSDDVLERVMGDESHDQIYREHMKERYIPVQEQATSNISEQKTQIVRLESAVNKFKTVYAIDQWKEECSKAQAEASELVRRYNTILTGTRGGIDFYNQTQEALSTLQKQTEEFLSTRNANKDDLVEKLANMAVQGNQTSINALPSPPVDFYPSNNMNVATGQPASPAAQFHPDMHFAPPGGGQQHLGPATAMGSPHGYTNNNVNAILQTPHGPSYGENSEGPPYGQHPQDIMQRPHSSQGYAQPPMNMQSQQPPSQYNSAPQDPYHSQYIGHGQGNWQEQPNQNHLNPQYSHDQGFYQQPPQNGQYQFQAQQQMHPSMYDESQAYKQPPHGQYYGHDQQPGYNQGYR